MYSQAAVSLARCIMASCTCVIERPEKGTSGSVRPTGSGEALTALDSVVERVASQLRRPYGLEAKATKWTVLVGVHLVTIWFGSMVLWDTVSVPLVSVSLDTIWRGSVRGGLV